MSNKNIKSPSLLTLSGFVIVYALGKRLPNGGNVEKPFFEGVIGCLIVIA